MLRRCLIVGSVFLPSALLAATPEPLALVNANVVDVRGGKVVPNVIVVVREGKIESVGARSAPSGARMLDLKGKYLAPGLIDCHTHISNLRAARTALESGVTTVRSSGVSGYADVGLRELARKGSIEGPDFLASGYHVRPRVAEEAFLGDASLADLMSGVDTPEKVRRMVRANLGHGVDWIKVLATERAGTADTDPRKQVYTEADVRAAVEEAATKGIPVQAHAHGDEGAMAAVRAGVRSIEHGTYLSEATLALMREKGTFFDPTYTTVVDLVEAGGDYDLPALRLRGRHMLPRLRDALQRAIRSGVKVVTGADTGYGPNSLTRISHEVGALVDLGMTPVQGLRSATTVGAELLRLEKTTGAIEVGLEADFIAVDRNPLEDPAALQDVLMVVSNGRVAVDRLSLAKGTP